MKNLVLRKPSEPFNIGQGNRKTSINQVLQDLPGLDVKDVTIEGNNKEVWRELIRNSHLSSQEE